MPGDGRPHAQGGFAIVLGMRNPISALLMLAPVATAGGIRAQESPRPGGSNVHGGFLAEIPGLSEPASVAIGEKDEIYVLESLASRVRVFDAAGRELRSFGSRGSKPGELLDPRGLALAPDGEVYVSDTGNDRVQVFDAHGKFLRGFGIRGTGPSEFHQPLGLAVDTQRVWVADSRNHRVQVFLRDGRYANEIGRFGHEDGELDHPSDVAVDSDWNAYVADTDNQRICVFDRRGDFVRAFGGFGPYSGLFMTPSGIRFHAGRLYVADRDNHRIHVYDPKGELLHEFGVHSLLPREGAGKIHYPNQIAVAPSGQFVALVEGFEDRVQFFGPQTEASAILQVQQEKSAGSHYGGAISSSGPTMALLEPSAPALLVWDVAGDEPVEISRFGHFGSKPGQLVRPQGVALSADAGRAYVTDPGLGRLSVFDVSRPAGAELAFVPELVRFVKSLDFRKLWDEERKSGASRSGDPHPGDRTPRTTWPIEPGAVKVGPRGDLWMIDEANARVVVLDTGLVFVRSIGGGSLGTGPDSRLARPVDLALSPSGEVVYVVDAAEARVKAFDDEGRPLFAFGRRGSGPGDFASPFGITVGPDAGVYVSDEAGHRILRFDAVGRAVQTFGSPGTGRVEFWKPRGLAFDARGRLVVIDWGNHRGQILTPEGEFVRAFGSRFFVLPTQKKP